MENATDNEVSIKKNVSLDDGIATFNYQIDISELSVGRLRLVEQLSEPVELAALRFGDHDHGRWERETASEISFISESSPPESLEATFQLRSKTLKPEECGLKLTTSSETLTKDSTETVFDDRVAPTLSTTDSVRPETNGGTEPGSGSHNQQSVSVSSSGLGLGFWIGSYSTARPSGTASMRTAQS